MVRDACFASSDISITGHAAPYYMHPTVNVKQGDVQYR